jgi:hypothetical protein
MMKPRPYFESSRHLEEAAEQAEQRKREAIARLTEKLGVSTGDRFEQALRGLIDADKRALQERRK